MRKLLILILLCFTGSLSIVAQKKVSAQHPLVGQPSPDYLLQNIRYFSKKQAHIHDFKGKWLVLDFWNKACSSCISAMPHQNDLAAKYKSELQIMLVGAPDKEREIYPLYDRLHKSLNLTLPCAFDERFFKQVSLGAVPFFIVIDPKGVVRFYDFNLTPEIVDNLISHKIKNFDREAISYNPTKPLLINGNGGVDSVFLYRSILAKWDQRARMYYGNPIDTGNHGLFQVVGINLRYLYNYAFYGNAFPIPHEDDPTYGRRYERAFVLVKDTSLFNAQYGDHPQNLFSYSIYLPRGRFSEELVKRSIRAELENYTGFVADTEKRECPYWALTATKEARQTLKTKGKQFWTGDVHSGISTGNWPVSRLVGTITGLLGEGNIVLDETGIEGNIDLKLDYVWANKKLGKPSLINALRSEGLDLVLKYKPMTVIVIRDK